MSDIFISYASQDRPQAQKLAEILEQKGWSVWWDREIIGGQRFETVIEEALSAARCIVVLWSTNSRLSDWVKYESAAGKRRGILVPAFIEDTSPPSLFNQIHTVNLVDWDQPSPENKLDRLFDAIRNVLKQKPKQQSSIPRWKKSVRLAGLTLVIGLLIMGLFKTVYPQTPVTEALTTIFIFSIIIGAGLDFCWTRWRGSKAKQ